MAMRAPSALNRRVETARAKSSTSTVSVIPSSRREGAIGFQQHRVTTVGRSPPKLHRGQVDRDPQGDLRYRLAARFLQDMLADLMMMPLSRRAE
jgi:hypothetical protein